MGKMLILSACRKSVLPAYTFLSVEEKAMYSQREPGPWRLSLPVEDSMGAGVPLLFSLIKYNFCYMQ